MSQAPHVVVTGAGAFGGWTALWLRRAGARVTLLDAWGPGNTRASSGGETRIIRAVYGPDRIYVQWAVRAFELWREHEARWGLRLYHPTGAVWLFAGEDGYARSCLPLMSEAGLPFTELSLEETGRRFPQFDLDGVRTAFYEEVAGYLLARRSCRAVVEAFIAEGGEYRQMPVRPGPIRGGAMERVELADGSSLDADLFVFACGPWLGQVFPDAVGERLRPTRQEVYFFGTPAEERRWDEGTCPIWMDFGKDVFYGIPGNEDRGFKVAEDTRREEIDPTSEERLPSTARLDAARRHLARRFPGLAGAPLLEARVCQYENTVDGHFLLDRHPEAGNVWLAGGGSGHGFKFGPVLGENLARWVMENSAPPADFALARLDPFAGAALRSQLART